MKRINLNLSYAVVMSFTVFPLIFSAAAEPIKIPSSKAHRESKPLESGPFKGIDPSDLDYETGALILAANTDFTRLIDGMEPFYAVQEGSSLMDGGTRVYKGAGYRILRLKSISTFGKLTGHSVGVELIFDKDVAPGNNREFAETSFLADMRLSRKINEANKAE